MSVKPVNGQCPEGYILVDGGEDGAKCVKNPFQVIKNEETGKLEYDKEAIDALSRYVKSYISGLPKDKVKDEGVLYNKIFSQLITGSGGSTSDPLTRAYLNGNKNEIEDAIKNANKFYADPPYNSAINIIGSRIVDYPEDEEKKEYEPFDNIPKEYTFNNTKQQTTQPSTQSTQPDFSRLTGTQGGTWSPPIPPPTNPQGQVEFMQQQAQQMPVPNEVSSRVQLPPVSVGMPEAEQQVGMQEEMPQDNGSIFQRLRNLFSGKAPQPPQPNVAPQVTPQTTPQQPVDNRVMGGGAGGGSAMNEMMPKEFQNAQNLGQQVTQPGMFGGGVGDGGSMGQSATTGLSGAFATAGESPVGTTGTVAGATNVNTGALPKNVVDNATQTNTGPTNDGTTGTQTTGQVGGQVGGGTQPPPFATPGIVGGGMGSPLVNVLNNQVVETVNEKGQKSKSMQDLIEIGGTGFDDEVLARKLRRQAAMPDLKNEDYYPNQPFTQAQTAWGDPIFSGAGALFPMAAYDAQIRARAQAEIDEAKRNVMQVKIPEVKTAAYYQKVRSDFTNEIMGATNEAVKRFGGNNQKAMQYLRQSGILAQIENKYNALAMNIDQFADEANAFLKVARENPDKIYSSLEGVKAANNFLAGMNAFNNGEITAEQLNGLRETFQTAERWSNYKKDALEKYADDEVSPGIMGDNLTPEEEAIFQRQLNLPDGFKDKRHFLVVKKYSEANEGKIKEAIVKPFFNENRTALEQLRVGNETKDQTIDRMSKELAALRGTKIYEDIISESESKGNTTVFNFNPTGGQEGMGFHESTLLSEAQIRENLNKNRQNKALTNEQLVDQSFGGSWRARPNDPYVRASVPGQIYDANTTPLRYSDYLQPTGISGQGSPDRQWNTISQKDLDTIGAKSTSETPKFAKIVGVEMSWAVRDPKTNQWNMVTADNLKKYGMPPNAKMVIVEQNLLYNEEPSEGGSTTYDDGKITTQAGTGRGPRKAIKAVRVLEATPQNVRFYDDITNPKRSNEGAYGVPESGTATTPSTGQNISLK